MSVEGKRLSMILLALERFSDSAALHPRLLLRAALKWNVNLAEAIERRLPRAFTRSLLYLHEVTAAEMMNARSGQTVVDVGGGYLCPIARRRRPELATRIVALDIDESQLRVNQAADLRAVADAARALPLADHSIDIIVTRSVMEHLPDTKRFLDESFRVLKPGSCAIHVFPCRNSPFALLNQALPSSVSKWLLATFHSQWKGEVGFPAFYRNCNYREILRRFAEAGYAIDRIDLRYYQAIYFNFFLPAYLFMLLYDYALWRLDARQLACQILIVARRPGEALPEMAGAGRVEPLAHDQLQESLEVGFQRRELSGSASGDLSSTGSARS